MLKVLLLSTLVILQGWKNCGGKSDHLQNLSLTYSPVLSEKDNINLIITGDLNKEITGGNVNYKVLLGPIPVYTGSVDICSQVQCPVPKGKLKINATQKMPDNVFPGRYEIQTIGNDQDDEEIFCAKPASWSHLLRTGKAAFYR